MPAAPINRLMHGSTEGEPDCGLVALAVYLDVPYTEVVRVAAVVDRNQGRMGLWTTTMIRIADVLGHRLKRKRRVDWDDDYGILRLPEHAAVLRQGLVLDRLTVWDADDFLRAQDVRPSDCELLLAVE